MKKVVILFFIYFSPIMLQAQSETELAIFRNLITSEDRINFFTMQKVMTFDRKTFDALLPIIIEKKDSKTYFFWHYFKCQHSVFFHFQDKEVLESLSEMQRISNENKDKIQQLVTTHRTALISSAQGIITQKDAFTIYLNLFEEIRAVGFDKFSDYHPEWQYYEMGRIFFELGDYDKALESLSLSEKYKVIGIGSIIHTLVLNLIQTIYAEKKEYDKAIFYAQKINDLHKQFYEESNGADWRNSFWQGLSYLDMASYMLESGRVKESEIYANKGNQIYNKKGKFGWPDITWAEYDALQVIIRIKMKLNKWNEVEPLIKRTDVLLANLSFSEERNYFKYIQLYKNYIIFFEAKKDFQKAFQFSKVLSVVQDSLNVRNDKRKLFQIEMRINAEKYQARIDSAEKQNEWEKWLRNMSIIALFLFSVVAIVVYTKIKKDNKIISDQKNLLEQSLDEKDTLLKEIHHRVKNNLQIITGLLEKQAMKTDDAMTKQLMKEGQDRVYSMALVHQNLYQSENLNVIELKPYLQMLSKNIQQSQTPKDQNILFTMDVDNITVNIDMAIPLGLILNELITNCYKYAFEGKQNGEIGIVLYQIEDKLFLTVKDNGIGLPPNFDLNKTNTLGMNLVRGLVRQLEGTIQLTTNSEGTVFEIKCKN